MPSATHCSGAASLRDIGYHFPDTDPAYKGADSRRLLREVVRLLADKGYAVGNVDLTIMAQAPKMLPPHPRHDIQYSRRPRDRPRLCIGKGHYYRTTPGSLAAEEGIAAMATALIYKM